MLSTGSSNGSLSNLLSSGPTANSSSVPSSIRILPTLQTLAIKAIAKAPSDFIDEKRFNRAIKLAAVDMRDSIVQTILDSCINAGRLTDDVFPFTCLDPLRTSLSLKNAKVGGNYVTKIITQCPYLLKLDISGCFLVTDDIVYKVVQTCRKLEVLCIRNCRKVTDKSLHSLVELACPTSRIHSLHLGGIVNLTEDGILYLVSNHSNMVNFTCLHFAGIPLNESILVEMSAKCKNLKEVSFSFAEIHEIYLKNFFNQIGSKLERVCVSWIGSFGPVERQPSSDFILHIGRVCPLLKEIDVTGLKYVTKEIIQQLIDFKESQAFMGGLDDHWESLQKISTKFVGSSKPQIESLQSLYPQVEILV